MLLWLVQASEPNDDVTKILIYWFESQCIVGRHSLLLWITTELDRIKLRLFIAGYSKRQKEGKRK